MYDRSSVSPQSLEILSLQKSKPSPSPKNPKPRASYTIVPLSPQSLETLFLSKNQNLLLLPKIQNQNPKLRMRKKEELPYSPSDKPRKGTWYNDAEARIL